MATAARTSPSSPPAGRAAPSAGGGDASVLPDPVAGAPGTAKAADADDLLSQLAGDEIDRLLAAAEDPAPAQRPPASAATSSQAARPAPARSGSISDPPKASSAGTKAAPETATADEQADLEREVIDAVLRDAGDALSQETTDALLGKDAVPPPKAPPPVAASAPAEDAALADELDALFAELSKSDTEIEKLAGVKPAAPAKGIAPVEAPPALEGASDAADDETQKLLDAVFDEATKDDFPAPSAGARPLPSEPTDDPSDDSAEDSARDSADAPEGDPDLAADATEPEPDLAVPATAEADAGLAGDLLQDDPALPGASPDADPTLPDVDPTAHDAQAAAVPAALQSASPLLAADPAPAAPGTKPKRPGKPTTHRGPPFTAATKGWRPGGTGDNVLGMLPDVERHRARWLVAFLEALNRPFDFLSPELKNVLGWAAILTLFNAAVVLVYVSYFRT